MKMELFVPDVTTKAWPKTFEILKKRVPGVLKTQCFNEENLPFRQEVKRTEVGHLFEHLVLEFACMLKIKEGHPCATHCGRTFWNWENDRKGIFWIYLDIPAKEKKFLVGSVARSISVIEEIMGSNLVNTLTTGKLLLPVVA